ncbi:unnamed protein product [Diplocarpon coronariae]
MADSAAKRRKISPTTSIPINAPATPSRIPVPRKDGPQFSSRRPSFASPTKVKLSKHHLETLDRPASSGTEGMRPDSRGTALKDVAAKGLGEDSFEGTTWSAAANNETEGTNSLSETHEISPVAYDNLKTQIAPPRGQIKGPGEDLLPGRPRKQSQSPNKRPERMPVELPVTDALPDDFNPFQKKGLRRSPVSSSAEAPPAAMVQDPMPEDNLDPFRKTGLRRSPVSSLQASVFEKAPISTRLVDSVVHRSPVSQAESGPRRSPNPLQLDRTGLRRIPTPSQGLTDESMKSPARSQPIEISPRKSPFPSRAGLRRSPVFPQALNNFEPPEQAPIRTRETALTAPANPATPPEVVSAERPKEARPGHEQPEARQQIVSTPVDPVSRTRRLFTESSKENEEHMKFSGKVLGTNLSTTPTESPCQDMATTQVTEENEQKQEPSDLTPSQKSELSIMNEAVQDLLAGAYRVEEPDLPPPTQLGIPDPVVISPRANIHVTPSKRGRSAQGLGAKLKSSPLKPRDASPEQLLESVPQSDLKVEKSKRRKSARLLVPEDPHISKKKVRDGLLKELQQLQADVALANRENERLRGRSESRKKGTSAAPSPDELQEMLLRTTAPDPSTIGTPKPTSIFKSINAFLPFRSRRKPAATPISEKPIPSHLPITPNDRLPYLQAFSTLLYSSKISVLPSQPRDLSSQFDDQPVLQRHIITASHPSGLFSTRFSITVDTSSLRIVALDLLKLDMNAEKELGAFIRARASSESVLGRDITVVCWAMSRWTEVSIQRARFWCAVVNELSTPEARAMASQKKRKRKWQSLQDEDRPATSDSLPDEITEKENWTRRQLLSHIGRSSLEIGNNDVELRFEWKISFDWTGEVESVISASARLPRAWQQADDRSSLNKVPGAFKKLVKEQGPLDAVRAIVRLLM